MSTQRNELAVMIAKHHDAFFGVEYSEPATQDIQLADTLIAAGWTKPRVIDDVESRDALPDGTVVRSSAGTIAARFDNSCGVLFGMSLPFPWENLTLPLTVLWEPQP